MKGRSWYGNIRIQGSTTEELFVPNRYIIRIPTNPTTNIGVFSLFIYRFSGLWSLPKIFPYQVHCSMLLGLLSYHLPRTWEMFIFKSDAIGSIQFRSQYQDDRGLISRTQKVLYRSIQPTMHALLCKFISKCLMVCNKIEGLGWDEIDTALTKGEDDFQCLPFKFRLITHGTVQHLDFVLDRVYTDIFLLSEWLTDGCCRGIGLYDKPGMKVREFQQLGRYKGIGKGFEGRLGFPCPFQSCLSWRFWGLEKRRS